MQAAIESAHKLPLTQSMLTGISLQSEATSSIPGFHHHCKSSTCPERSQTNFFQVLPQQVLPL